LHFELNTQQSHDCLLCWLLIGGTSSPLTSGHRCEDWSTPVHAGVLSRSPSVVNGLLDAGGDLRLHDSEGRTPFDWLRAVEQEGSARVSRSVILSLQRVSALAPRVLVKCDRLSCLSIRTDKRYIQEEFKVTGHQTLYSELLKEKSVQTCGVKSDTQTFLGPACNIVRLREEDLATPPGSNDTLSHQMQDFLESRMSSMQQLCLGPAATTRSPSHASTSISSQPVSLMERMKARCGARSITLIIGPYPHYIVLNKPV
uniref:ANK_REP_REGION domain-containing protein n=1 Tax=Cyclopterus lumpus TaxID=8103 RepID=A0A8C2WVW8_CYCLU